MESATLYQLTDLGRFLDELLDITDRSAENNWAQVEVSRRRRDRRDT